jgi:hypothetical protein
MKIDFHTHSKLGKKLPFSPQYTEWHLRQAKLAGLDAICITEHYNGIEMESTFDYIQANMERVGDAFVTGDGLTIFMGLEIDALEGGHFLISRLNMRYKRHLRKIAAFFAKKRASNIFSISGYC